MVPSIIHRKDDDTSQYRTALHCQCCLHGLESLEVHLFIHRIATKHRARHPAPIFSHVPHDNFKHTGSRAPFGPCAKICLIAVSFIAEDVSAFQAVSPSPPFYQPHSQSANGVAVPHLGCGKGSKGVASAVIRERISSFPKRSSPARPPPRENENMPCWSRTHALRLPQFLPWHGNCAVGH